MSTFKVHNLGEGARSAPIGYSSWNVSAFGNEIPEKSCQMSTFEIKY